MSRGSEWRIWDLHVHTPHSSLNNQFGDADREEIWEHYVSQLEQTSAEKGVVCIGVTDYFTIDGYRKLREFQQAGRLSNLLLLPNIEFRVDKTIYRHKAGTQPKRLNIHVLFSPQVNPNDIEEKFLHDLDFVFENEPFDPASKRKLKKRNLVEFGKHLREQHPPFATQSGSDFDIGCLTATVSVDQINDQLKSGPFRGQYMIVLADEDLSIMDWDGQDHAVRKQLLQMSHALFSSNAKSHAFCLGHKHASIDAYISEFKSLKPCIWGCDSHGFAERFLEPDGKRYCWIKGDVTWEGLRQVIFEPEDRVRIQAVCPEKPKSIYSIKRVQIEKTDITPQLGIARFDTPINGNLVAIIGGRGSGKTALLDIIARCFREGRKLSEIPTSFFARVYADDAVAKAIPVSLAFDSSDAFSTQIGSDEHLVFEEADLLYLTQDHFEEYAANPARLYAHIIDLVFDKQPDDQPAYSALTSKCADLQKNIQRINLEIQILKVEISGSAEQENSFVTSKKGDIANLSAQLSQVEVLQGSEINATRALTEHLATLREEVQVIESLIQRLSELHDRIEAFRDDYLETAAGINRDIERLKLTHLAPVLPDEIAALGKIETQIAQMQPDLMVQRTTNRKTIDEVGQKVADLQGISKTIADLQQKRDQAHLEIKQAEARLVDIQAKEDRLKVLETGRQQTYANMLTTILTQRQTLQTAILKFESGKDDLLSNLSFSSMVDLSGRKEYVQALAERADNRSHSEADVQTRLADVFEAIERLATDNADLELRSTHIAADLVDIGYSFRLKSRVAESEFLNLILTSFLSIGLDIAFNSKPLSKLSMGERAVVLLKIMMGLDDRPLLIDQPENHLDNRYIYDELKPAFRTAKTKRQIIIATHNANLVVNTDAEQIIIADNVDGCIQFSTGTLEDAETRERITKILEGGKEAFLKREQRYGYRI